MLAATRPGGARRGEGGCGGCAPAAKLPMWSARLELRTQNMQARSIAKLRGECCRRSARNPGSVSDAQQVPRPAELLQGASSPACNLTAATKPIAPPLLPTTRTKCRPVWRAIWPRRPDRCGRPEAHVDKYAERSRFRRGASAQNERKAEKINSLRAELARVMEEKDAVIELLRADETLTAGSPTRTPRTRCSSQRSRLTAEKEQLATQVARSVAPATLVEANRSAWSSALRAPRLQDAGGGRAAHPHERGQGDQDVLELERAGEPVTPPPGFQIRAAHIDGSQTPLTTDEVKWSQRVDGKRGLNDPPWDGRLMWLNVGDLATNVFDMPSSTLELSAFIYPYYGS